jgi:hypothetical protein
MEQVYLILFLGLLIGAIWWCQCGQKSCGSERGHSDKVVLDPHKPPSNLFVEYPNALKIESGQRWPDPVSGGCSSPHDYGLITPSCGAGNRPDLVFGGSMKCTNKNDSSWTGCVQATKAL